VQAAAFVFLFVSSVPATSTSTLATTSTHLESKTELNVLAAGAWSLGIAATVFVGGTRAWWDEGYQGFTFKETGWLERDTYSGGHDKIGHLFSAYSATHTMAFIYESYGMSHTSAIWAAIGFNTLVMNGFEFVDGFTQYGFEYADSVANTLGFGLAAVTWLYPRMYDTIGMRVSYLPSNDFLDNERTVLKFVNDYTGQIYYFDLKFKGLLEYMGIEPGFARYWLTGVAFSTNHYSPIRRHEQRQRLWGVHLGLNMSEVLEPWTGSNKAMKVVSTLLNYGGLPFLTVALLKDLNDGPWYVNFGIANKFQVEF
jgi:hypothetical protein